MSDLLEKVISTSTIGTPPSGGGLLKPEQSDRFIDYMWDATTLGSQVRTERLTANEVELDRMAVGERIVRLATEATDDALNVKVAFTKVSLTTKKLRVDWELSSESLEDNLEGEALDDHIARLISSQAANDIEDLAINGDVNLTNDWLLKSFDGWRKRLYAGANVVDAQGSNLDRVVFNKALRAMPRKFMDRRGSLKFYTSAGLLQDYMFDAVFVEAAPGTAGAVQRPDSEAVSAFGRNNNPGFAPGWSPASPFGVQAQEVPLFPEYEVGGDTASDVWLVDPKNLIWAVKRGIKVYREFKPRKDSIEYSVFTRVGGAIENPSAAVLVKNVKYKS